MQTRTCIQGLLLTAVMATLAPAARAQQPSAANMPRPAVLLAPTDFAQDDVPLAPAKPQPAAVESGNRQRHDMSGQQHGTNAAGVAETLAPLVRAQDYSPPDLVVPLPVGHARMDDGGLYTWAEFLYFKQNNPLKEQIIANRGIVDADGSIARDLGLPQQFPGQFIGGAGAALRTSDIATTSFQPGYSIGLGWRFRSGLAVEFGWWHLVENKYSGGASIEPFGFNSVGIQTSDTFLTAPVFNFPVDFSGPDRKLLVGNPGAAFGIWDAASVMTISFVQRFDQWEFTGRIPVYDNDDVRFYGLFGPRLVSLWERFKWRTVSIPIDPNDFTGPEDAATYSVVVSNRLYGVHFGCGSECRLGDTPMGTFAVSFDAQAALFVDFVKARAKYERDDRETSSHSTVRYCTLVPELQGNVNLWWYPIEGVQLRVGYNAMTFFNTIASPRPINFNYQQPDAEYEHITRWFYGLNAGLAFIF